MKRHAVLGSSLALALATSVAGVALGAAPASAADEGQLALAPLPDVLTRSNLFGQPAPSAPKGSQPAPSQPSGKGEEKGGKGGDMGGGGEKQNCRRDWNRHQVRNEFFPIGYTIEKGFGLANLIPNYPAGFPAYNFGGLLISPMLGLGGGTEIFGSLTQTQQFGLKKTPFNPIPRETDWFFGGGAQKRLTQDKGVVPAISIGFRGNMGPQSTATFAPFIVGTKKLIGKPCAEQGVYLTAGAMYERYSSDRLLALQTPIGAPVPLQADSGLIPFVSLNNAVTKNLFLSGEWAAKQRWESQNRWAAKGTLLVYRGWGVQGGVRSNGYNTRGFIGLALGQLTTTPGGD